MSATIKALKKQELYELNPLKCHECNSIIPYKKRKSQGKLKFCCNKCSINYYTRCGRIITEEGRIKMSVSSSLAQARIWNKEKRKEHSKKMRIVVNKNPQSYSSNNVCGRVKPIKIVDSYGKETKCLGQWELLVADFLNKNNIKWTNKIDEIFEYEWNGSKHRYFPDFKLPEENKYIEVKGYERDRDRAKWCKFPNPLVIIKLEGIKKIKNGSFSLTVLKSVI